MIGLAARTASSVGASLLSKSGARTETRGPHYMMENYNSIRLNRLPIPLKLVVSLTLIVLGIGYVIAMINLYLTYHLTDGEPGLTVSDLRRSFYGNRDNTKLAAKINGGSMEQFLTVQGDKEKILTWIQDGAERPGYEEVVKTILTENCVRCHNPAGLQRFTPLTSYEEVMVVTQIDRGEPVALWARVAHTHIQSIGLIFLILGAAFCLTSVPERWKIAVVTLPFVALLVDFGARFLAKYFPQTVYVMMFSGAFIGALFAVMILVPLWDMWFRKSLPGREG